MTPRKAAAEIGCSPGHVRKLVQQGKLKAKRKPTKTNRFGYVLDISPSEVRKYKNLIFTHGGWPRGKARA